MRLISYIAIVGGINGRRKFAEMTQTLWISLYDQQVTAGSIALNLNILSLLEYGWDCLYNLNLMKLITTLYDTGLMQLQKNGLSINVPQAAFTTRMNLGSQSEQVSLQDY